MTTYNIYYTDRLGGKVTLDKPMGSEKQALFLRQAGIILSGRPDAHGKSGAYYPGGRTGIGEIAAAFAAEFSGDAITLTKL